MTYQKHPRDTYITVYGRKPVVELLEMEDVTISKLLIANKSKGDIIKDILALCKKKGIVPQWVSPEEVSRISKNPNQDQGIAADVLAPGMDNAQQYFSNTKLENEAIGWLALDGVTTPANVGMIIRSATALGMGVILPLKGSSKLNPLVVKASAGVVFKSKLLKCETLDETLKVAKKQGYSVYGLAGEEGSDIYTQTFKKHAIFVMGNETEGVSESLRSLIDGWLTIPMAANVESLNVACAATVVASEWMRREGEVVELKSKKF
jgi:23S rRNA (guanosine2251-2'-O)-methyltransferase